MLYFYQIEEKQMDDKSIEFKEMENGRFQVIDKLSQTVLYDPKGYKTKGEAFKTWYHIEKNKALRLQLLREDWKREREKQAFTKQLIQNWNVDEVKVSLIKAGYTPILESVGKEFHLSVVKKGQTYIYVFSKTKDELLLDQISDLF